MTFTDDKMKVERITTMCNLKREIMSYLFEFVSRKKEGRWWKYKGEFIYDGKTYNLECECKYDNSFFTYRNLHIEHKQVVIDIDEMVRDGLLQ
jgi:hypothetical protein